MSDIPNTKYITINKDGIFVGGKPATHYRGVEILFIDATKILFAKIQKKHPEISELHVGAFETSGAYAKPGNPSGKFGRHAWCRAKSKDGKLSSWVFRYTYGSASVCANDCAYHCGFYVQNNSVMRSALLDFVKTGKVNSENKEKEQYETVNVIKGRKYRITIEKLKENTK